MVLYSQHLDFKNKHFIVSGCGIMSLLMLMEYLKTSGKHQKDNLPTPDKLYQIGLNRRALIKDIGWRHTGLVGLAKLYGFKSSQNYDWSKLPSSQALKYLQTTIKQGPVMASVYSKFKPKQGGHLVVLLSLTPNRAIVLDPDDTDRSKIKKTLSTKKFLQAWKGRIIEVK